MKTQDKKYRIGIICPSEVAFRRFLPSLVKSGHLEYAGVAVATPEEWADGLEIDEKIIRSIESEYSKAEKFQSEFGGEIISGYQTMIDNPEIDAVYLPLPPALHKKWAERTLLAGKHAYVEKPFTTTYEDTAHLITLAKERNLAVHENYMFLFHKQLDEVKRIIDSGELGKVRQYRINFGFPLRPTGDFRYFKKLGGGAVLDAGGYCMKLASWLLGPSAQLVYASSYYEPEFEVDIFGNGIMKNDTGVSAQFSFGMDCDYKCELEIWGSRGTLTTGRILTAPDGLQPDMTIKHNQDYVQSKLPSDFSFQNSIRMFVNCINDIKTREENYKAIERQSAFLSDFIKLSDNGK